MDLSPGEQVLDLLHVEDVVSGFRQAAQRLQDGAEPRLETYLMGGTRLTVRELAQRISHAAGRTFEAHWGRRPYRLREVMEPVDPGAQLPGWVPKVSLDVGLAAAYRALESA
jgi:nucleoside-diphosphate-sugar epimerase